MPALVAISDLHLGAPSSLLSDLTVQESLAEHLGKLGRIDNLLLLGDILDLTMAPRLTAWNKASAFFELLFKAANNIGNIHYIPGNHDHHVWSMLSDYITIVAPLEGTGRNSGEGGRRPLGDPMFCGEVGPKHETFLHCLFPAAIRNRLHIRYPFYRFLLGNKLVIAHHGHYFDWKICPLAMKIAKASPDNMEQAEECNAAWIESLFYLLTIGRVSRTFLKRMYGIYQKLEFGLRWWTSATGPGGKKLGGIPISRITRLIHLLQREPTEYTLLFGHTHSAERWQSKAGSIKLVNTGGWNIDDPRSEHPVVESVILVGEHDADDLETRKLQIDDDIIASVAEKARSALGSALLS